VPDRRWRVHAQVCWSKAYAVVHHGRGKPDERSRWADLRRAGVTGACGKARTRSWLIANHRPDVTQCVGGAAHRTRALAKNTTLSSTQRHASPIAGSANRHPSVVCVSATRHVASDAAKRKASCLAKTAAMALTVGLFTMAGYVSRYRDVLPAKGAIVRRVLPALPCCVSGVARYAVDKNATGCADRLACGACWRDAALK
jgi:hypothetical protein